MISETIKKQIIDAMKAKDELRVSTLKLLSSALHYEIIKKQADLTSQEEIEIVRKEAKKRKDAIDIYDKAKEKDRAEKEKKELLILQEYLPKEVSDEELEKIVIETISEVGAKEIKEMGKVIGVVMGKVKGRAEGGKVAELVKSKLT